MGRVLETARYVEYESSLTLRMLRQHYLWVVLYHVDSYLYVWAYIVDAASDITIFFEL